MSASLPRLFAVVSKVKEAAESFKNPMFRNYFVGKATEELQLLERTGSSLSSTDIEDRLKINVELEGQLRRQSGIQNLYYDEKPIVDK